ncbi:MAG: sugar ABC transporter permease [Anaerolineales bacterium]|nr:sugar ABC transporter permease [Anaerolineales bacterium]
MRYAILSIGVLFAIYPIVLLVWASVDSRNSVTAGINPEFFTTGNYTRLFSSPQTPILKWLGNSVFVSGTSTLITLTLTTLGAYSFSRYRFKYRQASLLGTLIIQMFPSVVALVAFYLLLQQIGEFIPFLGLNSLGGLILIYSGGALGAGAWLMKGYFDTVPRDLDESAQVDGATHWVTFTQVILPLVRPILAVTAILSFIGTFNDYLLPRVLISDQESYTLAVGLANFISGRFTTEWGVFAAGALLGTLPIILIFIALQSQIVSGLSSGAVKG